eukprot:g13010.t1
MWGSAGFGLANFISGVVYDHSGYTGVVTVFMVVLAGALAAAIVGPVGGDDSEPVSNGKGGEYCQRSDEKSETGGPEQVQLGSNGYDGAPDQILSNSGDVACEGRLHPEDTEDCVGIETIGSPRDQNGTKDQDGGALSALWTMFSTPQNACFFTAVVLTGVGKGVINTFLYVWLVELGGPHVLLGLAGLVTSASEVPFFYLSGHLIEKLGAKNVVALAQLGYLARFGTYAGQGMKGDPQGSGNSDISYSTERVKCRSRPPSIYGGRSYYGPQLGDMRLTHE